MVSWAESDDNRGEPIGFGVTGVDRRPLWGWWGLTSYWYEWRRTWERALVQ